MGDFNSGAETWGNGPATSASAAEAWKAESNGIDNWNDGSPVANTDSFNDFPASVEVAEGGAEEGRRARGCFNCGEEGHLKSECTKPRVFTGECRDCGATGHRASDCPSKPKVCKQCGIENDHDTIDCKNRKLVDNSNVAEMSEKDAWKLLQEASDDYDMDEFKEAIKILSKAVPELTYVDLEKQFREKGYNMYLIALKNEVAPAYTNVNLQGEVGKTYTLGVFARHNTCPRKSMETSWPKNEDENMERLHDVGLPMERGVPVCNNCGELGHQRKNCQQERNVVESVKIVCALCSSEGHRLRDCPEERPQKKERQKRTCRFCESEDHIAKDCPDAPKPECRNCYETGHKAADCTNERVMKCRNCDEIGHTARECKAPKDWTRVTCRHCNESGHGSEKMCDPGKKKAYQEKVAAEAAEDGGDDGFGDTSGTGGGAAWEPGNDGGASGGWEASGSGGDSGQASWETNITPRVPAAVGGGGMW